MGAGSPVDVASDGEGAVSHAGVPLLAEAADRLGLTACAIADPPAARRHDPGRVVRDLALMLADGGACLSDPRAVRNPQPLVGPDAFDANGVSRDRGDRRRPGPDRRRFCDELRALDSNFLIGFDLTARMNVGLASMRSARMPAVATIVSDCSGAWRHSSARRHRSTGG
jgi:hypothetical protein